MTGMALAVQKHQQSTPVLTTHAPPPLQTCCLQHLSISRWNPGLFLLHIPATVVAPSSLLVRGCGQSWF